MDLLKRNLHIILSFILFVMCLGSVGFYQGVDKTPQFGIEILALGWMGILGGQLGWLANLCLISGWLLARSIKFSLTIIIIGLCLALKFVTVDSLPKGSSGSYDEVAGFGWGYYFWVSSIITMLIGQIGIACGFRPTISIFILTCWLAMSGAWFFKYQTPVVNVVDQLESKRDEIFTKKCGEASEQINSTATSPAGGIYIDADDGEDATVHEGRVTSFSFGRQAENLLEYNVPFIEISRSGYEQSPLPYERLFPRHSNDKPIKTLESRYGYFREGEKFPPELHLSAAKIIIKDLSTNTIMATSSYIYDEKKFVICSGSGNASFSAWGLLYRVLNIKR